MGTPEALFVFNVFTQRCLVVNQQLFVLFIDYNKAMIRQNRFVQLLKDKHVDKRTTIITHVYFIQTPKSGLERNCLRK